MSGYEHRNGTLFGDGVGLAARRRAVRNPAVSSTAARSSRRPGRPTRAPSPRCRTGSATRSRPTGTGRSSASWPSRGAGADIVSGGELLAALRAGFPPERIVFAGVGKTDEELALGLETGHRRVQRRERGGDRPAGRGGRQPGGARRGCPCGSTPTSTPGRIPTSPPACGRPSSGCPSPLPPTSSAGPARFPGCGSSACSATSAPRSWTWRPLGTAAVALAELSRSLLDEGFDLETIDLGGGLGVDYEGGATQTPPPWPR